MRGGFFLAILLIMLGMFLIFAASKKRGQALLDALRK